MSGILNGDEIIALHRTGEIDINPWDKSRVGSNSYDVTLDDKIVVYKGHAIIDPRKKNETEEIKISDVYLLNPGDFILGSTFEYCSNNPNKYEPGRGLYRIVPMIEGRSSIARLGLCIHITAGFGDVGFCGKWTLEMTAARPILLYPKMPIGQLYWIWTTPTGRKYKGKYQDQKETMASKSYEDFRRES
jgi:dCTP deaminase